MSTTEELGYFYDSIHGSVSVVDLPDDFVPALKSALLSKSLDRLKRISQLGHTSISFFSATHNRFSHSIGTMLVMNKLFKHIQLHHGLSNDVFIEVENLYPDTVAYFASIYDMIHCHLLLAALYQDVGEMPFQKVTSLYFTPVDNDVTSLVTKFPGAKPRNWKAKNVYSILSLIADMNDIAIKEGFKKYSLDFLTYLITGDGVSAEKANIPSLHEMMDGVIDADRLDYVYRDASATIGSISSPTVVLESIVRYEPKRVIVNDPRPVTDFLSTRMRLITFVYSSPDVRFRQVLLKTVLDGYWDRSDAKAAFNAESIGPELSHDNFMKLDDHFLMDRINKLKSDALGGYRQQARKLLLYDTFNYECRVLKRSSLDACSKPAIHPRLPEGLFFDLLADHGQPQLYRSGSVFVSQALTSRITEKGEVQLEDSAGALSPLFKGENTAMLVSDAYYVFMPKNRSGEEWKTVERTLKSAELFPLIAWEDAQRNLICPLDTTSISDFPDFNNKTTIGISYCEPDFPTIVRIVRYLYHRKRRYRIYIPTSNIGSAGGTSLELSRKLITQAGAAIAVVSREYISRALDNTSHISAEVRAMHGVADSIPIVVLGIEERKLLTDYPKWSWCQINESWRNEEPVISNDAPLSTSTKEILERAVDSALEYIDNMWSRRP
jgi:HD superfamily phosphohydrolase